MGDANDWSRESFDLAEVRVLHISNYKYYKNMILCGIGYTFCLTSLEKGIILVCGSYKVLF